MNRSAVWILGVVLVLGLAQALAWQPSEPFYNNDETRHVMTGVFFRDLLLDLPLDNPREYATEYYLQYPALGLLVWPPLFHGVAGVLMVIFGTSFLVAKAAVWLFAALACAYLFLIVRRTHGEGATLEAVLAALLFGLSPMALLLTRHVMLEMPALAFALAAVFHFLRYLDLGRRLDLIATAAASAGFALTRFDGPFLLLFFLIYLLAVRRFDVLRRPAVWIAGLVTLAVVLPVYLPTIVEFGRVHLQRSVQGGVGATARQSLFDSLLFYPSSLVRRIGWFTLVPSLVGFLVVLLRPERRRACRLYLALAAATFLTFAPLAELEERHGIYWYPAFALFAVEGIHWIAGRLKLPRARAVLAGVIVAGAFWEAAAGRRALYVRGYEEAARYVVAHTRSSRFTFMDGFLNGGFIYQVRRLDSGRRLWVLRGDKLLYGVVAEPGGGYREHAGGEDEILDTLFRYDPELIVVEEPQVRFDVPMGRRLRQALADHPERFERVKSIPVESNVPVFRGVRLDIYRSRIRNPNPEQRLSFEMMGLGRSLAVDVPSR